MTNLKDKLHEVVYIQHSEFDSEQRLKSYVLTGEELRKLLEDAFDAGTSNGCKEFIDKNNMSKRFVWVGEVPPTKEQYINNLTL